MKIKSVTLTNFRNYQSLKLDFCGGYNLVSGANGQGKTNLAESLVLLSIGSSPRTHHDEDMVLDGASGFSVEAIVERDYGKISLKCTYNGDKTFYLNGNKIDKLSSLFGNLVTVYFNPSDLEIVSGSPDVRRDFMDKDISELSGNYYNLVQRYNKVLFQRNKLLKNNFDHKYIIDQIDVWDEQLATIASLIIKTRKNFIEQLQPLASNAIFDLSSKKEDLKLNYVSISGDTQAQIKQNMLRELKNNLSKDIELGYTQVGPHRDDIKIELNGKDSKIYSSQGQKRTIVLAIKLAELKLFSQKIEKPVLVLDDCLSELDGARQKKLYSLVDDYQVIITGTTFKYKPQKDYINIKVKAGKVKVLQKNN